MNNNEEITKIKKEIDDELKNNELTELIKSLCAFLAISIIFGYCGYSFCLDNNYDTQRGIVYGALFPMGLAVLKETGFGNFFTYVIYTVIYIFLIEKAPTYVGIVILSLIIIGYIIYFIVIIKKDRTKEIASIYRGRNYTKPQKSNITIDRKSYTKKEEDYTDYDPIFLKEEYYCARCEKQISEEEYDEYGELCEDCFTEVNSDDRYYGDDFDLWR